MDAFAITQCLTISYIYMNMCIPIILQCIFYMLPMITFIRRVMHSLTSASGDYFLGDMCIIACLFNGKSSYTRSRKWSGRLILFKFHENSTWNPGARQLLAQIYLPITPCIWINGFRRFGCLSKRSFDLYKLLGILNAYLIQNIRIFWGMFCITGHETSMSIIRWYGSPYCLKPLIGRECCIFVFKLGGNH